VTNAANLINEKVRQQENMEAVLRIQSQFGGQISLFTLDRRLVRSGQLIKVKYFMPFHKNIILLMIGYRCQLDVKKK